MWLLPWPTVAQQPRPKEEEPFWAVGKPAPAIRWRRCPPSIVDYALVDKGGKRHNPDFSGREQMPRLANQRED